MKNPIKTVIAAAVVMTTAVFSVHAQQFPNREVTLVVNFGAGGVTDIATRLFAKYFEKELGVTVLVTNRPGASATLGPAYVARQKPDGYTIGVLTFSAVAITPNLIEVPYEIKDFDFLGVYGRYRYGLVVGADSPFQTVAELVEAAKVTDKPLFFAAPSAPNNLAFFELSRQTGAKFEQILYKSGTDSVTATAAGEVVAAVQTPPEINPLVDSGNVRMLASVSPKRWTDRPNIPTMLELGYDISIESWMSLALPAGTPANVMARLNQAFVAAATTPEYMQELNNLGLDPVYMTGQEYADLALQGYKDMRVQLANTGQKLAPLIDQ